MSDSNEYLVQLWKDILTVPMHHRFSDAMLARIFVRDMRELAEENGGFLSYAEYSKYWYTYTEKIDGLEDSDIPPELYDFGWPDKKLEGLSVLEISDEDGVNTLYDVEMPAPRYYGDWGKAYDGYAEADE